jgi:FkbM family methyltransferase
MKTIIWRFLPPRIRWMLRSALGRALFVRRDLRVPIEYHGSEYGGWAILRNSLSSRSRVFSFGLGEDVSFDLSLIAKYGCTVHGFDPTPRSLAWLQHNVSEPRLVVHGYGIAKRDGKVEFALPADSAHVSATSFEPKRHHASQRFFTAEVRSLETILDDFGWQEIDLLKMDVEGSEVEILEVLVEKRWNPAGQLLVEFHPWFEGYGYATMRHLVAKMREVGWRIAWVSERGHEILWINQRDK